MPPKTLKVLVHLRMDAFPCIKFNQKKWGRRKANDFSADAKECLAMDAFLSWRLGRHSLWFKVGASSFLMCSGGEVRVCNLKVCQHFLGISRELVGSYSYPVAKQSRRIASVFIAFHHQVRSLSCGEYNACRATHLGSQQHGTSTDRFIDGVLWSTVILEKAAAVTPTTLKTTGPLLEDSWQ